ncbi:tetratricopeptide repeat protein [Solimicrobium silvestre]|uniref:Tetratricopeptide repeat n=1 Tax=Solimicrobium silvestre TaxID=2099400 RepID=A0A2S9H075_9BURK|nr:tetratricopeptide repeat protein [Solimicrobium silvestre]PRC93384.1 Tetratricopeptide repeat [Solimicrobium silvestre]
MTKFRNARLSAIAVVLGLSAASTLLLSSAYAETPAASAATPAETLRPEISKSLAAAQVLFEAKNYPDALAKLAETDAIANKTSYETYAVERSRGNYLMASGDKTKAAQAFEAVVGAHYLVRADQLNMIQAISQLYFQLSNYPLTISWMERYLAEGGTDPRSKIVLNQARYLNKDYAIAFKGISAEVQDDIAAGHVPSEQNLKLLLSCMGLLNDKEGTLKALEQLNSYYPNSKNWLYLVSQLHSKPGYSDRLALDVYRLKQELALMSVAADYTDMSELATRAGLPAEAKKALDEGFAAGLLDKGPDAKKHASLLATANKHAEDDLKTMQQGEASANKNKGGAGLVNLGMAYATAGQFDKAISLIEQGISKGGLTNLEDAKLHLGIVYYWAGKKDEAIKQLSTVQGADGTADLARYWVMQINHPLAK